MFCLKCVIQKIFKKYLFWKTTFCQLMYLVHICTLYPLCNHQTWLSRSLIVQFYFSAFGRMFICISYQNNRPANIYISNQITYQLPKQIQYYQYKWPSHWCTSGSTSISRKFFSQFYWLGCYVFSNSQFLFQ